MLSVIIPPGRRTKLTEIICNKQLRGMDFELILADTWKEGLRQSKGEFVSLMDADCDMSDNFFKKNLKIFTSQPSFRKLAMVSSSVSNPSRDFRIYGYILSLDGSEPSLLPSNIRSSSSPYGIQVGYLPGSIIRRNAIRDIEILNGDPILDSIKMSLDLWIHGSRCYINPDTTYFHNAENKIQFATKIKEELPEGVDYVQRLWRREMIG